MDTTYKFSYPCKVISSFFDNFYQKHVYDLIKKITLRKEVLDNDDKKEIYRYFLLFNMCFTLNKPLSNIDEMCHFFSFVFNRKLSNKAMLLVSKKEKESYSWISEALDIILEENAEDSFFVFLVVTITINNLFAHSCVIPVNIISLIEPFINKESKICFLNSLLYNLNFKEIENLKEKLICILQNSEKKYADLGVDAVYLYGSILNNDYHENSDIDLVIQYKPNTSFKSIQYTEEIIKNDLFILFNRKTDIHEFNDYIYQNDITKTFKIF